MTLDVKVITFRIDSVNRKFARSHMLGRGVGRPDTDDWVLTALIEYESV
jgi:hypothetical protein